MDYHDYVSEWLHGISMFNIDFIIMQFTISSQ